MPGIVKVKVIEGRNLPVMDRSADTTDAYVELKLGNITYKTEVCRKSLNPQWHSEWYKFEMDDAELQDEPLQVRLMDHDTYSANDMIGKVYFNLNPLLLNSATETLSSGCISGWFPVYDTIHGLRGEVNLIIKLELFSDFNKFRQSSCGVHIFSCSSIPYGYYTENIYGFVEELVVEDDPEYQWIEKIRTPRASNEARQAMFYKMSGELQRKIGLKVIEMGGNAVIGYRQCYDLEGESGGVVIRGIGTAVKLIKQKKQENMARPRNTSESEKDEDEALKRETATSSDPIIKTRTLSESGNTAKCSECPKETVSSQENESVVANAIDCGGYNIIHKENIEMMEYPFLTLTTYPEDFIIHLGGTVSARSVKLLARISNIEEPETRDAWWTELRVEIKSHMRALACNAVLNYVENTSICDEVCVLNASGTAAVVRVYENIGTYTSEDTTKNVFNKNADFEQEMKTDKLTPEETLPNVNCSIFHIPYRKSSLPFPVRIKTCELCKRGFVADVIFVTIEPPDRTPIIGQSAFVHAFVYRLKRDCKSELNAREISDGLPFLEYDLNRQLLNKLKIKGMNAIFGLNIQVAIGEKMISAHATGTAVLLSALPSPPELTLVAHGKWQHPASKKRLNDARKLLEDATRKNKIHYQLVETSSISDLPRTSAPMAAVESTVLEPNADLEYCAGFKHTCVIEVDDEDDLDAVQLLIDPNPPQGFLVSATEKIIFGSLPYVPKKNIQLFAQVYRYRIPINTPPSGFNKLFFRIVQALYVKIHNRIPCSLNKVSFKMDIPEPDELQIRVVGMALALKESERVLESVSTSCSSVSELADDFILNIDSEKDGDSDTLSNLTPRKQIIKKKTDTKDSEIQITSLSYIPGANISFYLGNLNFVFIRESTMVKEQTGGVNNFVNNLLSDVTTIVKSHAAGIGGNAVVNFFLNECLLITHSHKNQGQCLINVGGDVVRYVPRNTKYQNQSTTFNV